VRCPYCAAADDRVVDSREAKEGAVIRRRRECNGCGRQTSVTAGTVFANTKLVLNVWFLAMHLITQAKNGICSLELSRQLGISQNSAWPIKHKLMQATLERDGARQLAGLVQIDDAYWGGRRRGYKRGRGTRGTTPIVAAVEIDAAGHPRRMSLNRVKGFRSTEIARWGRAKLVAGTAVFGHSEGPEAGIKSLIKAAAMKKKTG